MAITPPSDIVLDVARAADPEKYRAAVERLARLRAAAPGDEPFTVPAAPAQAPAESVSRPAAAATRTLDVATTTSQSRRRLDAYGQFEAFVLQSFVESMLPKNATNVFGKGSAGEYWRSMLAERVGEELARSGQVGIAQRLSAPPSHPVQPGTTVTADPSSAPLPLASTLAVAPLAQSEFPRSVEQGVAPAAPVSERS